MTVILLVILFQNLYFTVQHGLAVEAREELNRLKIFLEPLAFFFCLSEGVTVRAYRSAAVQNQTV